MTAADQDWRNGALGTRVRVALWLRDEVGVGNTFSRAALRAAITGAEQVDRRMRDLRPAGWVIRTNLDKPSLRPEQLYLEKVGAPVWERKHRGAGLRQISAKTRRDVYARDQYLCRRCGIGAAEAYPDEPGSTARLTLGRMSPGGTGSAVDAEELMTLCARCDESTEDTAGARVGLAEVWRQIEALPDHLQRELLGWMAADARVMTPVERAWGLYRQLPTGQRDATQQSLRDLLKS
ncbi:HNH endonuclease [Streptomyces sp. NPDC002012]|uniref:HNH endonuclease n=1 Tax=Streptomyces sp. NPDC002012 TaxID=3154532 RepID=UPI003330B789